MYRRQGEGKGSLPLPAHHDATYTVNRKFTREPKASCWAIRAGDRPHNPTMHGRAAVIGQKGG